ncbi:hypothetical protein P691DRAFT_812509 [Macrolepiota fuliginosa MF-IS2]|uniref:Aminoglycoside phosphotransferase domain-containing protein n=1 Tax=Macrolepiota fuliginosa MF-IS2 TaxID=1400762 RepID=A0A9P6CA94_9AGAR|nr:hypothetical protein P691DRAFT_812509 [Macrolepiota fuliginosa MF-IS2]
MSSSGIRTFDLTTEAGVEAYLADTPFACTKAEALSGGFGNFTFRLRLRQPRDGHETLVLKHAAPYVKSLTDIPFDPIRLSFEVEAMKRIREWSSPTAFVTVPSIHLYDEKGRAVIMDDCGLSSISLKEYMQQGRCTVEIAHRIGKEIGEFLGMLHTWGRSNADVGAFFDGNKQAKVMSIWVFYGRILPTFEDGLEKLKDPDVKLSEEEASTLKRIVEETSNAMKEATGTFVMGDFWPGNVMLSFNEGGDITQIRVLDWELCKPGVLGIELGQFCAELILLMRFNADICEQTAGIMLEDFLKIYATHITPDLEMCRRAIVHLGTHLVTLTPRIAWGGKEMTQKVVKEGLGLILEGYGAEREWLRKSAVGPLVVDIT